MADGTFHPNYKHIRKRPEYQLPLHYLRVVLGRGGIDAEQDFRRSATEGITSQVRNAESAARRGGAYSFGMNNPSGMTSRLMTEANLSAPYAGAELGAKRAGFGQMIQASQGASNIRQSMANEYSTLVQPWLQEQAMKQAAAGMLAGAGAGGGGFGAALGNFAGSAAGSYFGS